MTETVSVVDEYERVFGKWAGIPMTLSGSAIQDYFDFLRKCIDRGRPMSSSEEESWFGAGDAIL